MSDYLLFKKKIEQLQDDLYNAGLQPVAEMMDEVIAELYFAVTEQQLKSLKQ
jgi:hypothetical protein